MQFATHPRGFPDFLIDAALAARFNQIRKAALGGLAVQVLHKNLAATISLALSAS
jgi:hypothetical protein